MSIQLPRVPWQVTGNHWINLPCIHPADASIHCVGGVHAGLRGAIEFAGGPAFLDGASDPLIRLVVEVDGKRAAIGSEGIAWERESGWIPAFSARLGDLTLRGTICAPHGKDLDVSGFVIVLSVENRGNATMTIGLGLEGTLGHRQYRVRTARVFDDAHVVHGGDGGSVVLRGADAGAPMSLAVGGEGDFDIGMIESACSWTLSRTVDVDPGGNHDSWFHVAAGMESDGALAVLRSMRRRGGASLIETTRRTLRDISPATGSAAADRLIARHVFFCYFGSIARALDQSHWYIVRSRMPWSADGMTIRDWHAMMWILPAVLLVDRPLAREALLRICELHGYQPGGGVHYLDGSMFEPGFSLEGAASFAVGVDAYIVESADDRIVEEPVLAESLYGSQEDIESRRDARYPLYSTEVNPDGTVPANPFTAHGNAVVALALDILRHTLDEKSAENVQDPAAVRASLLRQFSEVGGKAGLACSSDLAGKSSSVDESSASVYWLSYYDLLERDDSTYRRTVKKFESEPADHLEVRVARLLGPSGGEAFDWLRRAPLDNGLAARVVDENGKAIADGGDAALSGLIAHTVWYAVHALGVQGTAR